MLTTVGAEVCILAGVFLGTFNPSTKQRLVWPRLLTRHTPSASGSGHAEPVGFTQTDRKRHRATNRPTRTEQWYQFCFFFYLENVLLFFFLLDSLVRCFLAKQMPDASGPSLERIHTRTHSHTLIQRARTGSSGPTTK